MASLGEIGGLPVPASSLLGRRRLLGVAAAVTTVGLVTRAPAISYAPRSISLYNTHTGEWLRTVYWADGHYIREAVRDINWILRDHHTDEMRPMDAGVLDRKSTRLNSSHTVISYAVFCLKKKKIIKTVR